MFNIGKKDLVRDQQAVEIAQGGLDQLAELGKDKFYEVISQGFDLNAQDPLLKCYSWLMKKYYLEHANKGEYFLDVGCGIAPFVFKAEKMGYISSGLEMAIPKLMTCYQFKKTYPDKQIDFYPGRAERLPFANKWFDVVNSTMVIEHVRCPFSALFEMIRVGKIVTGIIHMDDQVGSPYHTWHFTEGRIKWLLKAAVDYKLAEKYKIEYLNEGHSRCCVFILHSAKKDHECRNIEVQKIDSAPSMIIEWEESYYEAIKEYGKQVVEDPVSPICVRKNGDRYKVETDGTHRVNALRRTEVEKIRVQEIGLEIK